MGRLGLAVLLSGGFITIFDLFVVNVAIPSMQSTLSASFAQISFIIAAYELAYGVLLIAGSRLGDRHGRRRLFMLGMAAFALASALCGLAPTADALIAARILQGMAAAMLFPQVYALIRVSYQGHERRRAFGLLGMTLGLAAIAGQVLGGWIVHADLFGLAWRSIFLINVPLGIFAALVVGNQLKGRPEQIEKPKMDYVGLVTLVIGVGALQLVLDLGNDEDWFASTKIVVLACVAVVALAVFLIWELTDKDPIVDLKLFRHRNFRAGTLAMVVAYAAFFSVSLLIPQWLQRDMGYTAIWAGLATAPIGILPVIMTPFVGKYASRFDMRMIASFAFVFLSFTSFMRSDFNLQVDYAHVAGVQLIMGIGVALFFMPVLQILLSDLDGREIAAGSGLATFLRTLGGSFAASLTTWLWARRTQVHHADLTEHISAYQPGMQDQVTAMGQGDLQHGAAVLNNMINHQASQMAFNDIFYLLGWTFLAIIAFLWLAKPPFGAGAASAGGH